MAITGKEFLQKATKEISITGFEEGEILQVLVKRVSIIGLIKSGKISNTLLNTVQNKFGQGKKISEQEVAKELGTKGMNESLDMIDALCEACMVQPTFEEVKEYLTDQQKMDIYLFTQQGVDVLDRFHSEQTNS